MAIDFNIIGKRLKGARNKKGLTQEQLVEQMGVSIAYLSKIETGKIHINLERLSQICNILDVTEGEILNGVSSNSDKYLSNEFSSLLKKCNPKQQHLAYKILQTISEEKI
jgi:transcriptional regulator with XRE-family HTH domain